MFLSKLALNIRDAAVRRDLRDPYEMHKTLWAGFPHKDDGGAGRVLFRVDSDRHGPAALVQSVNEPNWSALPAGYLRFKAEAKAFTPAVTAGQRLRFRLRANPTKRVHEKAAVPAGGESVAGKRVGLLTEVEQIKWLIGKGEDGGFTVPGEWVEAKDPETKEPIKLANFRVDAIPEGRVRDVKNPGSSLLAVRFEGVLIVSDPGLFAKTLAAGVGSAKGFGFGLLSVAPA